MHQFLFGIQVVQKEPDEGAGEEVLLSHAARIAAVRVIDEDPVHGLGQRRTEADPEPTPFWLEIYGQQHNHSTQSTSAVITLLQPTHIAQGSPHYFRLDSSRTVEALVVKGTYASVSLAFYGELMAIEGEDTAPTEHRMVAWMPRQLPPSALGALCRGDERAALALLPSLSTLLARLLQDQARHGDTGLIYDAADSNDPRSEDFRVFTEDQLSLREAVATSLEVWTSHSASTGLEEKEEAVGAVKDTLEGIWQRKTGTLPEESNPAKHAFSPPFEIGDLLQVCFASLEWTRVDVPSDLSMSVDDECHLAYHLGAAGLALAGAMCKNSTLARAFFDSDGGTSLFSILADDGAPVSWRIGALRVLWASVQDPPLLASFCDDGKLDEMSQGMCSGYQTLVVFLSRPHKSREVTVLGRRLLIRCALKDSLERATVVAAEAVASGIDVRSHMSKVALLLQSSSSHSLNRHDTRNGTSKAHPSSLPLRIALALGEVRVRLERDAREARDAGESHEGMDQALVRLLVAYQYVKVLATAAALVAGEGYKANGPYAALASELQLSLEYLLYSGGRGACELLGEELRAAEVIDDALLHMPHHRVPPTMVEARYAAPGELQKALRARVWAAHHAQWAWEDPTTPPLLKLNALQSLATFGWSGGGVGAEAVVAAVTSSEGGLSHLIDVLKEKPQNGSADWPQGTFAAAILNVMVESDAPGAAKALAKCANEVLEAVDMLSGVELPDDVSESLSAVREALQPAATLKEGPGAVAGVLRAVTSRIQGGQPQANKPFTTLPQQESIIQLTMAARMLTYGVPSTQALDLHGHDEEALLTTARDALKNLAAALSRQPPAAPQSEEELPADKELELLEAAAAATAAFRTVEGLELRRRSMQAAVAVLTLVQHLFISLLEIRMDDETGIAVGPPWQLEGILSAALDLNFAVALDGPVLTCQPQTALQQLLKRMQSLTVKLLSLCWPGGPWSASSSMPLRDLWLRLLGTKEADPSTQMSSLQLLARLLPPPLPLRWPVCCRDDYAHSSSILDGPTSKIDERLERASQAERERRNVVEKELIEIGVMEDIIGAVVRAAVSGLPAHRETACTVTHQLLDLGPKAATALAKACLDFLQTSGEGCMHDLGEAALQRVEAGMALVAAIARAGPVGPMVLITNGALGVLSSLLLLRSSLLVRLVLTALEVLCDPSHLRDLHDVARPPGLTGRVLVDPYAVSMGCKDAVKAALQRSLPVLTQVLKRSVLRWSDDPLVIRPVVRVLVSTGLVCGAKTMLAEISGPKKSEPVWAPWWFLARTLSFLTSDLKRLSSQLLNKHATLLLSKSEDQTDDRTKLMHKSTLWRLRSVEARLLATLDAAVWVLSLPALTRSLGGHKHRSFFLRARARVDLSSSLDALVAPLQQIHDGLPDMLEGLNGQAAALKDVNEQDIFIGQEIAIALRAIGRYLDVLKVKETQLRELQTSVHEKEKKDKGGDDHHDDHSVDAEPPAVEHVAAVLESWTRHHRPAVDLLRGHTELGYSGWRHRLPQDPMARLDPQASLDFRCVMGPVPYTDKRIDSEKRAREAAEQHEESRAKRVKPDSRVPGPRTVIGSRPSSIHVDEFAKASASADGFAGPVDSWLVGDDDSPREGRRVRTPPLSQMDTDETPTGDAMGTAQESASPAAAGRQRQAANGIRPGPPGQRHPGGDRVLPGPPHNMVHADRGAPRPPVSPAHAGGDRRAPPFRGPPLDMPSPRGPPFKGPPRPRFDFPFRGGRGPRGPPRGMPGPMDMPPPPSSLAEVTDMAQWAAANHHHPDARMLVHQILGVPHLMAQLEPPLQQQVSRLAQDFGMGPAPGRRGGPPRGGGGRGPRF